ncbi:MAG TPA: CHASE domain-containing protein [Stellaceae bacterium]|nr:CHASE domain-containing protein [Stellaceae bacterium]
MTRAAIDAETESRLDRQIGEMTSTLEERMDDYVGVLHGAAGLFAASPSVSREQWRSYVDTINLRENLPSIQALGFAPRLTTSELDALLQDTRTGNLPAYTVWPDGPRDELVPVLYSEPNTARNQSALGFDMLSEPTRRAALDAARDLGAPVMSAKLTLVQDRDADQPGFLLYLPLYRAQAPADTVDARRAALKGYVYAAFRMQDLITATFPSASNAIGLEIYDGLIAEERALLYRASALRERPPIDGATVVDRPIAVSNHSWILRFVVLPSFGAGIGQNQPTLILLGGAAISLLVSLIVLISGWNRTRTAAINARLETDVEHRKQVEAQLRDSEQRFRDIAEVAGDWIWETDAEHRFTLFAGGGREHLTALGFPPDRAIGRTRWEISGVDDPEQDEAWRQHRATLSAGLPFRQFRYTLTADNGERLHMLVSGKPVFDSGGNFTGYRGTATDETKAVTALARAEHAEALLRDAIESISEGFVIFDHEDRFVMCNETYRKIYPDSVDQFVPGTRFEDMVRDGIAKGQYREAVGREEEWLANRIRLHRQADSQVELQLNTGRHVLVSERRMRNGGIAGLRVDITALKLAQQAASESEQRFRDVAEVSGDYIWETGPDHGYTYFNDQSQARLVAYGFSVASALGRPRWEFPGVDLSGAERWDQHRADLDARRAFRNFRYSLTNAAGERIYLSVSGKPFFDPSGIFLGYRGTAHDETGLVIALNRARQAEAVLQDAVDSISEGFIIFDHEDRFVMCNAAMRNLDANTAINHVPGVTFEETLRRSLETGRYQVEEADREEWLARRVRQHRAPASVVEIQLGDGRHILVSERRMRNGGVAGLRVDITALKLAQQAASESEKLARDIIDSALDAFIQMDDAGHVLEWNPQAEAIFGWTREQAVGKPLTGLIVPDDLRSRHRDGIARFLRDGSGPILGKRIELDAVRRDGQRIKIELSVTALPRGASYVFNAFLRDITEKLAAEAHLRQVQKMDAVGQLTGGLAHDFNNLLGIIIGNLDLLAELSRDDPATSELAKDVLEAALHGADLTRRLLAFARRQPLQPQQLDLNEMISGLAKLLGRTLGINIGIKLDLSPDLWPVSADRGQLEAALANLATNARDAMPKGGRIVIATRNGHCDRDYVAEHPDVSVGDYAIVEVSDTGTGMSPEVASRIFEPFFTTKEPGKGTGLGLSSVFGFVKQSGGHVNVYSEPGKGSTFRLYLPRVSANGVTQAVNGAPARPTLRGSESILAVEDNPKMRRILVKQLQDLGYRVLEADNAASALEILDRPGPIDLLLTDVVMPGLRDGFELAREAETRRPGLRVLLTSGFSETRFQDSEALNARRLLGKPYRKQDLARAVREALEEQYG